MTGGFRIRRFDALAAALADAFARLVLGTPRSDLGGYVSDAAAGSFQHLAWRDLKLPDIESGAADPRLSELGGRLVRIPRDVAAVEDLRSGTPHFPLVPYVGAYVHTPAPRANQALAVDAGGDAVESEVGDHIGSAAVSRSNVKTPYGPAAFQVKGTRIDPFERWE